MKFLGAFGFGGKSEPDPVRAAGHLLPAVNSYVDVAIGSGTRRESVPVNEVGTTSFTTRAPRGMTAGAEADFLYANTAGRFRFRTVCVKIDGRDALFQLPLTVKTLESYTSRGAARVTKVIPVEWRYAPDRAGYGEFLLGSMMDLSRGGASLAVDRTLKVGTLVETRFTLDTAEKAFVEVCEVVRAAKIESSTKNFAGIRFLQMDPANERMLMAYLHELQTTRRDRGVI